MLFAAAFSSSRPPYFRSPTIGQPWPASWARNWCFLPVTGLSSTSETSPSLRTTLARQIAGRNLDVGCSTPVEGPAPAGCCPSTARCWRSSQAIPSCQESHFPTAAGNRRSTIARYSFSTVRSRNWAARLAAADRVFANTTTPETGRSSRLTTPTNAPSAKCSTSRTNRLSSPRAALAVGRPAGLSSTMTSSSSCRIAIPAFSRFAPARRLRMPSESFRVILASQSPRRRELAVAAGWDVIIAAPPDRVEATAQPQADHESLAAFVTRLAQAKAAAVEGHLPSTLSSDRDRMIIACDTLGEIDGIPLGKPRDRAEAAAMIKRLSGRQHRVVTGVSLWVPAADSSGARSLSRNRSLAGQGWKLRPARRPASTAARGGVGRHGCRPARFTDRATGGRPLEPLIDVSQSRPPRSRTCRLSSRFRSWLPGKQPHVRRAAGVGERSRSFRLEQPTRRDFCRPQAD